MRIDAHQHFWKYSPAAYDWIDDKMTALKRDFLPDDLTAAVGRERIRWLHCRAGLPDG